MCMLATYWIISMIIMTTMLMLPILMSKLMKKWSNKASSFECGMSLNSMSRKSFSIRFFLLMILFIIFDIEVALIMASPILLLWSKQMMIFFMMFMMLLVIGIMYEWSEGSLNWKM